MEMRVRRSWERVPLSVFKKTICSRDPLCRAPGPLCTRICPDSPSGCTSWLTAVRSYPLADSSIRRIRWQHSNRPLLRLPRLPTLSAALQTALTKNAPKSHSRSRSRCVRPIGGPIRPQHSPQWQEPRRDRHGGRTLSHLPNGARHRLVHQRPPLKENSAKSPCVPLPKRFLAHPTTEPPTRATTADAPRGRRRLLRLTLFLRV